MPWALPVAPKVSAFHGRHYGGGAAYQNGALLRLSGHPQAGRVAPPGGIGPANVGEEKTKKPRFAVRMKDSPGTDMYKGILCKNRLRFAGARLVRMRRDCFQKGFGEWKKTLAADAYTGGVCLK